MPLDDAIICYTGLYKEVFSVKLMGGNGTFKASKLEKVLKRIIEQQTGNPNKRMMDERISDEKGCKT